MVTHFADVGGFQIEEVDSSRFKLVLCVLRAHQLQFSRVARAAEDLDEDIGVGASSQLLARLHRHVVRCGCTHAKRKTYHTVNLISQSCKFTRPKKFTPYATRSSCNVFDNSGHRQFTQKLSYTVNKIIHELQV